MTKIHASMSSRASHVKSPYFFRGITLKSGPHHTKRGKNLFYASFVEFFGIVMRIL